MSNRQKEDKSEALALAIVDLSHLASNYLKDALGEAGKCNWAPLASLSSSLR